ARPWGRLTRCLRPLRRQAFRSCAGCGSGRRSGLRRTGGPRLMMESPHTSHPAEGEDRLPRRLGVWSAAAVLVGSTIGSGIFRVPSVVAGDVETVGSIALLWVLGGLVALVGALTIAELAVMFPRSGGI